MTSVSTRLTLVLMLLLSPAVIAPAQTPLSRMPASARQLISIKVTGSKRYAEKDIAAASGLQLGTPVSDDDFKKAAVRLGDLGVFSDIGYKFSYSAEGTKLEFQVTDVEKFVPVRFEDFVWFSEDEMLSRIKQSVPLFNGEVPLSGNMPRQISDVLQTMLVERSIPGQVDYFRSGPSNGAPESILYNVENVLIQIRNVEFTGAAPEELPALKEAARRVFDREYSRNVLNALVEHQLLPVYHARGYLKAAFGPPQPKVVKPPSAETAGEVKNLTIVDVSFAVTPGRQYKLKALEWSGNHEFPTEVLQKMVRAEPGQPSNTVRLADNLKDIQKLYGSKGYVTAAIKVDADFDDAASTVVLHLVVNEGAVYKMGELEFRGLDNSLESKLRNAWKIRPGEVFDSTYLSEYLPQARKLLPSSALDWEVQSHVTANVRDKTVDVDLIYTAKAVPL